MEEYYEIRDMFVPFYLPISVDKLDVQEILRLTKSDKKMESGQIKFVLLKKTKPRRSARTSAHAPPGTAPPWAP